MLRLRSISKQIIALQDQIRTKNSEILDLERRISLLQQTCDHREQTEVEDISGKGWMSCNECGANVFQIY
jgi:hypothetical protein